MDVGRHFFQPTSPEQGRLMTGFYHSISKHEHKLMCPFTCLTTCVDRTADIR